MGGNGNLPEAVGSLSVHPNMTATLTNYHPACTLKSGDDEVVVE